MIWKRNLLPCWVNVEVAVTQPLISIVIVNYNSGGWLRRCLSYVAQQTYPNWEVIIVDNASQDNSLALIHDYDRVTIIRNQENRGFAAAQNQGIAAAGGGFVIALNFDLFMSPNYLQELVEALNKAPEAGWASGKLLNMTPDRQKLETIYAAGHIFARDRFAFLRGGGETDQGQYDQQVLVFGAPGAAVMYKREMIADISFNGQFFDEHLFTWYEDVDVDWRASRAGWRCLYVPTAIAYHVGHVGEEYREPYKSWRAVYGIRNRWLVMGANEAISSLRKDFRHLIRYELSSLLFVFRSGLIKAYFKALWGFLTSVSYLKSKRKAQILVTGPKLSTEDASNYLQRSREFKEDLCTH
jgi:GT2 family glycosyltransferase